MTPLPELWLDAILSRGERVPAFEVVEANGAWGVLFEDYVPGEVMSGCAVFPREQTARAFVAKVKAGLSPDEALEILLHKGGH
jgi:hypothetical protein